MMKFTAACGICSVLLVGAAPASAAPCRVALLPFHGPAATEMQDVIVSALPSSCVAVPGRPASGPRSAAILARELGVGAFMEGRVVKARRWQLRLWVRRGRGVRRAMWMGRGLKGLVATVQRGAPSAVRAMLTDAAGTLPAAPPSSETPASAPVAEAKTAPEAAPPAASEPAPAAPPADDPPPRRASRVSGRPARESSESTDETTVAESATRVSRPGRPLVEMSLGPRVISRTFTYTDNLSALPGYVLGGALAVAAEGEFYPSFTSRKEADIGLAGQFESAVGAKTSANGSARDTKVRSYRVGGRLRVPAGSFMFTLGGDYGEHRFEVDVGSVQAMAPNVRYSFLRPSVSMRIDTGARLSLGLTGAYLHILSVGEMNDVSRFPRVTAVGAEVDAFLGYAIDQSLEVRLVADLRHYAQTMHVTPTDKYIAGGALDEHVGGSLLLTYRLR
jgi:hypothetical protein